MDQYRLLVIGPRRGLIDVLRARKIPFSVWQVESKLSFTDAEKVVTAPLWHSREKIKEEVNRHFFGDHYTHVVAASESAVLSASIARRLLGAKISSVTTITRCRDKLLMKEYLKDHAIPMTPFMAESADMDPSIVFNTLGSPVVKKNRKSSGGKGISFIYDKADLVLTGARQHLLEQYVSAPEASVESFIQNDRICFTNITQYYEKAHTNFVPASFDGPTTESILSLNQKVIEALKINWGMTHLEVYLTDNGPLFGEIALRPPGGYIMRALQYAYGFNAWEAFLAMELGETFEFTSQPSQYCAVHVIHPGAGTVREVRGREFVEHNPSVKESTIKVNAGDQFDKRSGVGQDTGYFIHASDSSDARLALHHTLMDQFVIEMA